jgi:hypothetical protein
MFCFNFLRRAREKSARKLLLDSASILMAIRNIHRRDDEFYTETEDMMFSRAIQDIFVAMGKLAH